MNLDLLTAISPIDGRYRGKTEPLANYNLAFASYLLALLPIVIFYILCQKQIIGGVANGAVKG